MKNAFAFLTLIASFTLTLAHAEDVVKNRFTLPHTEVKSVKGVGKVVATLTEGEAIDVIYLDTTLICLDRRTNYQTELPPIRMRTKAICDYTGMDYLASKDKVVVGYRVLVPYGPSKCDTQNLANIIEMRVACADAQLQ